MVACCVGSVSGVGFLLVGTDLVTQSRHRVEQFDVDVVAVTRPVTALDVVADCLEKVGLVEVSDLDDVRRSADVDGVVLDSNDAALSIEAIGRELVQRVVCVVCSAEVVVSPA